MRLRFPWFRRPQRHSKSSAELDASRRQAALNDIGALLQTRREEEGLTLRQLASETRITTPVIEALERGWGDRLPERAYLASMLPQLERRLALPDGSLNAVLPPALLRQRTARSGFGRFTPGSIDVLTTWQGSVVYVVVICLSLLAVNRQQLDLASRNGTSLKPVPIDLVALADNTPDLSTAPEIATLRPLEQARRRQLQDWLKALSAATPNPSGVLTLVLNEPRQVQLNSGGGERFSLKNVAGTMTLRLQLPIQIRVDPAPTGDDQLLWNGELMTAPKDRPGFYRVEATNPAAPDSDRPQTDPRSP